MNGDMGAALYAARRGSHDGRSQRSLELTATALKGRANPLIDLVGGEVREVVGRLEMDVRAQGLPAGGARIGAEEGERGRADDAGEVGGAGVVADQGVGVAEVREELDVVPGPDDLGDGGEVGEVFLGEPLP